MSDEVRTRPRNRRETIITTASAHFHRRGYAGTSLEGIAGDLGITAPAIYRHFRGKDDLYTVALEAELTRLEACLLGASDIADTVRRLGVLGVEHPTLGLLWRPDRRRRLVDPDGSLERRLSEAVDALAGAVEPESGADLASLLARAALAVVSSTGFYASGLEPAAQAEELRLAVSAVVEFRPLLPAVAVQAPSDVPASRPWVTRRSALLDACAALVTARGGYQAVTVEEIAAAAEVTPMALYQLFESKAELFVAVLRRALSWAMVAVQQASSEAASADAALALAVASSLELSSRHPTWTGSLADELPSLPAAQQAEIAALVEEYLGEWFAVSAAIAGPATSDAVVVRMRAALAIVDDRAGGAEGSVLAAEDVTRLVRRILRRSE